MTGMRGNTSGFMSTPFRIIARMRRSEKMATMSLFFSFFLSFFLPLYFLLAFLVFTKLQGSQLLWSVCIDRKCFRLEQPCRVAFMLCVLVCLCVCVLHKDPEAERGGALFPQHGTHTGSLWSGAARCRGETTSLDFTFYLVLF